MCPTCSNPRTHGNQPCRACLAVRGQLPATEHSWVRAGHGMRGHGPFEELTLLWHCRRCGLDTDERVLSSGLPALETCDEVRRMRAQPSVQEVLQRDIERILRAREDRLDPRRSPDIRPGNTFWDRLRRGET
jgi:hypothetical protein